MRDGWICLHRKIMCNKVVGARKPYSRLEAWIDLIAEAAYEDHRMFLQGRVVEIRRGEVPNSERTMAEKWGWTKSAVHRFILCLKTESMADQRTDHGIQLLVITKYEEYQNATDENEPRENEKPNRKRTTDGPTITRETRETIQNKETISVGFDFEPQPEPQPQQAEGMPEKTQAVAVVQREGIEVSGCSPKVKRDRPTRNADVERIIEAYKAFKPSDTSRTKARHNLPDIFLECPPDDCLAAVERYRQTVADRDAKYIKGIGNFFTKANRVWEEYLTDDCLADVVPQQNHIEKLFGVDWNPGESDIEAWRAIARGCANGNDVISTAGDAADSGCDSGQGSSGPVPVPGF